MEKNALPIRVDYLLALSGKEVLYSRFDMSLEEVAPGIWAPVKRVYAGFPTQAPSRKGSEGTAVVYRKFSKFNNEVPDSEFHFDVAPGMNVDDRIVGTRYTFGKPDDADSRLSEAVLRGKRPVSDLKRPKK